MSPVPQCYPALRRISASEHAARRYSLARRNLLPRDERATTVSGLWAHDFLLRTGSLIETFLWCPDAGSSDGGTQRRSQATGRMLACVQDVISVAQMSYLVSERTLRRLHPGLSAPAMLSVVRLPMWKDDALLSSKARLLLVADGIEYAGNLGALVRTVDACGADGLIVTNAVARLTHSKVFVASRGTVLTTPVLECPSVVRPREALLAAGFAVYIADPSAVNAYTKTSYNSGRLAFVVGSEGEGVAPDWQGRGVDRVAIPMAGRADSLNVAASAAILLFDARARWETSSSSGLVQTTR